LDGAFVAIWSDINSQFTTILVGQLHRVGKERSIVAAFKAQLHGGSYKPGDRLPSTRSLAAEWGVSRTTVTAAYDQLIAEGYLEARQGARTVVASGVGPAQKVQESRTGDKVSLSAFGRRLVEMAIPIMPPARAPIEFRYGELAGSDFPTLAWRRSLTRAAMRRPSHLRYGEAQGTPALREALQGYVWRARGIRCDAAQIVVVNGSQQGIDLCARLLLDAGDRCVIENPAYHLARATFFTVGAKLVSAMVDHEGMRTDGLPEARLAYVTPSHQFPLGHVMTAARRSTLVAWARRTGAFIVEDDYDGEYRYDIAPVPPLQTLDPSRVIYIGTVSKTLSPTLRLGYLIVPEALRIPITNAKRLADRHAPILEQEALADFITSGAYEHHVRSARRRNRERRAAMVQALQRKLGERIRLAGAEAGLHLVGWIPEIAARDEDTFLNAANRAGLGLYPASPLYDQGQEKPTYLGILFGYAALTPEAIETGVEILANLLPGP
jgi:GntR family transcriptional regulator/MocR family aminotransferase